MSVPTRQGHGSLTSPGLPDLGAQHAPGWALPAASAPGSGRRPAHRRSSPAGALLPEPRCLIDPAPANSHAERAASEPRSLPGDRRDRCPRIAAAVRDPCAARPAPGCARRRSTHASAPPAAEQQLSLIQRDFLCAGRNSECAGPQGSGVPGHLLCPASLRERIPGRDGEPRDKPPTAHHTSRLHWQTRRIGTRRCLRYILAPAFLIVLFAKLTLTPPREGGKSAVLQSVMKRRKGQIVC